ncbi:MAG: AtpZ/AtpI family protein [bacterium]
MEPPHQHHPDDSGKRSAAMLMTIPTLLFVSPLVGFFLGKWLDRHFATEPRLTVLGVVLGFVAAGRETFLILRRVQQLEERDKRR